MILSNDQKQLLNSLISRYAHDVLPSQYRDGSFPAGKNGPHEDPETPVRNTAYWLYTLSYLVKRGFSEYFQPACRAAEYLMSPVARPMGASYHCRLNPWKDASNGLVGQAWVIECLVYASDALERPELRETAKSLAYRHSWSEEHSGWRVLNVDGTYGPLHTTFNQQLWFAAICSFFTEEPELRHRAKKHIETVAERISLYQDGVIFHYSLPFEWRSTSLVAYLKKYNWLIRRHYHRHRERARSVGYHAFNLVAFAYLQTAFPDLPFWRCKEFNKCIEKPLRSDALYDMTNKYAFSYNPVGFEYCFYLIAAGWEDLDTSPLISRQIDVLTIESKSEIEAFATDRLTMRARIYEGVRLLEARAP